MNFKRIIFLTSLFFLLFGFLFLFKLSSPVSALDCSPCNCCDYDPIWGTCYRACSPCKNLDDDCYSNCRRLGGSSGECTSACCKQWSQCPYSCTVGYKCVQCCTCPPPSKPCNPPCSDGDSDGDGVCNQCDPCPTDPQINVPAAGFVMMGRIVYN